MKNNLITKKKIKVMLLEKSDYNEMILRQEHSVIKNNS